ncbi:MAG: hypothetical protein DWQ10_14990 [Calditrichaeota bacterium]|nr:MAG: hypothetical protein DWQ10_14990 [Calditrichota bacterium]
MYYWHEGSYDQSITCWLALLEKARDVEDKSWQAQIYIKLITSQYYKQNYTAALNWMDDAHNIANVLNNQYLKAQIDVAAGVILNTTGNYERVISSINKHLPKIQVMENHYLRLRALRSIAYAYHYTGDQPKALRMLINAEKQTKSLNQSYNDI